MPDGYVGTKPDIGWWTTQVQAGMRYRKKYAHEARWPAWRNYYRGVWRPGIIPSNLFFRMLRTIVPRVYFRNPSVSITPRKPGFEHMALAQLLERVDNVLIRHMHLKSEMKLATQRTWMFGTGFMKLGFGGTNPGAQDSPIGPRGERFDYNPYVTPGMPWCKSVSTGSMVVPDGCQAMRDARWVAEWIKRPLDDVRRDPQLKNKDQLSGRATFSNNLEPLSTRQTERETEEVDLLEIRDRKFGNVILFAPHQSEKPLFFGEDPLQEEGKLNYYDIQFNPDDEIFWAVPDSIILEPQQLELNEIRTLEMKHRRLSLIRILVEENRIDPHEAAKLVSETVSPVVMVKGDPNSVVRVMEGGDIPDGLLKAEAIIMQDVRETMAMGRNQFGEFAEGSADRTAHEAEIVRLASEIRVDERRDALADVLTEIVIDMHRVLFHNWHGEQVMQISGPLGIPLWVAFQADMLQHGSYEVKVDPDTAIPETKALRETKAVRVYDILRTNPLIDPVQLTRYLLHELHGTSFDTMLRSLPQGAGGPANPLTFNQFSGILDASTQAGLLPAPTGAQ